MKVKCIDDFICEDFSSRYYLDFNIEYVVYAAEVIRDNLMYCLCDGAYSYYPRWKPARFFEITDPRISRYWIFLLEKSESYPTLSFPEWASQLGFYHNLYEKEKTEVSIFKAYKELMDLEFPNFAVTEAAQIIDREWIMCPLCIDAWECSEAGDALIRCPKCQTVWNNPRYKNIWPHF